MTEFGLSKEEAMRKYSGKGLYLMTVNIWYDNVKVGRADEDYLWGVFRKRDAITQYAKQKIAAKSGSVNNKFDREIYEGSAISTLFNNVVIPKHTTWEFVDKGNFEMCTFQLDVKKI